MQTASLPEIPTLDISEFINGSPAQKREFSKRLGKSFEEIGFAVLSGHPISLEQQQSAYATIDKFFKLFVETKQKYEVPGTGGARGYTGFGKEHAKDSKVGDLKEFFHIGIDLPEGNKYVGHSDYPSNVSVKEVPEFDPNLKKLWSDLYSLSQHVLAAIAMYLDLPADWFKKHTEFGNSILRPIHYPPLTGSEEPSAIRAAAHEDINLITLLIGASYPGLQARTRSGEWLPITARPSEIVINCGDMLQRLTNYKFVSTTHRVVNPERKSGQKQDARFSLPFFVHPESEMSLAALPQCVSDKNPAREAPILAGEYLNQRLREIGLKI